MCQALQDIMAEDFKKVEARGEATGEARGENRFGILMDKLFTLNRFEDAKKCTTDVEYRKKLYQEFKLA